MKTKMKVLLAGVIFAAVLGLSACSDDTVTINVFNWGEFINPAVLDMFYEETGIRVNYETYATNQEMYNRLVVQRGDFDVLFPSGYMIERLINEGRLAPINWDNVPNAVYLHPYFRGLDFDPHNRYSVPYMWGTFGILYNRALLRDIVGYDVTVDSWEILWDARFTDQIYMYDSPRCTIGAALKLLGFSQNTTNVTEVHQARDLLIAQMPLVRAYLGDQIISSMINNGAALAIIYSGDAWYTMSENADLNFIIPREGTQFFIDAMVIPATSTRQVYAEMFINFMTRPDIALMNTEWIGYSTTNAAALEMLPAEWRNSPVYWPTDEMLARTEPILDVGDFREVFYDAWAMIMAASN